VKYVELQVTITYCSVSASFVFLGNGQITAHYTTGHNGPVGIRLSLYTFLTTAPDGMGCQRHEPTGLPHKKETLYLLCSVKDGPQNQSGLSVKFCPTEIRSQDRPALTKSLYRLSYPCPPDAICVPLYRLSYPSPPDAMSIPMYLLSYPGPLDAICVRSTHWAIPPLQTPWVFRCTYWATPAH